MAGPARRPSVRVARDREPAVTTAPMTSGATPGTGLEIRGRVEVPADLAGPLLRLLVRALRREVREDGGVIPTGIEVFLADLAAAVDGTPPPAGSANGTCPGAGATVEVPVLVMAGVMGASPGYVRRLCRVGRLRARRVGGRWLVELSEMEN